MKSNLKFHKSKADEVFTLSSVKISDGWIVFLSVKKMCEADTCIIN